MTALRAQTIALRKAGTRERYVVNDDGAPPAELAARFTFLAVLGAADAITAPIADRWSPTAQVLLSTALAVLVAGFFGLVIAARVGWHVARVIGPPLLRVVLVLIGARSLARRVSGGGSSARPRKTPARRRRLRLP